MKYLSSAVNFAIKNWMLILPVFVLVALANLISYTGAALSLATLTPLLKMGDFTDPSVLFSTLAPMFASVAGAGIISFIAKFLYTPATYGLINKGLESGNASLNDIGLALNNNFVKYVIYFVGLIVVAIVGTLAAVLVLVLLGLILSILGAFGQLLMILVVLTVAIFFIVLMILLSMWFSAMVVDSLDVVAAAKKSIEIVKGCFWTVVGISLLVAIVCGIASSILGFLTVIPLLGPIIYSAVPAIQFFVMAVFYLMIYREKTGRLNNINI